MDARGLYSPEGVTHVSTWGVKKRVLPFMDANAREVVLVIIECYAILG